MSTFVDCSNPLADVSEEKAKEPASTALAEDGYPLVMEIPNRYIKGMEGDKVEARRRWIATLKVSRLRCCLASLGGTLLIYRSHHISRPARFFLFCFSFVLRMILSLCVPGMIRTESTNILAQA